MRSGLSAKFTRRRGQSRLAKPSTEGGPLRPREREVVRLLLEDRTCREIASILEISDRTVEHHVERLKLRFRKATLHGLLTHLIVNPVPEKSKA